MGALSAHNTGLYPSITESQDRLKLEAFRGAYEKVDDSTGKDESDRATARRAFDNTAWALFCELYLADFVCLGFTPPPECSTTAEEVLRKENNALKAEKMELPKRLGGVVGGREHYGGGELRVRKGG